MFPFFWGRGGYHSPFPFGSSLGSDSSGGDDCTPVVGALGRIGSHRVLWLLIFLTRVNPWVESGVWLSSKVQRPAKYRTTRVSGRLSVYCQKVCQDWYVCCESRVLLYPGKSGCRVPHMVVFSPRKCWCFVHPLYVFELFIYLSEGDYTS